MAEGPPKLAWRPGAIVLFGAGLVLTVGAVVARDPTLLFLALPLLIVPVAAASMVPAPVAPGRLVWRSEGAGPSVSVLGTLTGVPSGTQGSITLGFERPPPLEEEAAPEVVATDEGFRFRLSWRCPYPLLTSVPLPRVVASDPLGLAERILGVAGTPLPIERFPPEAARLGTVQLRRTTPIPGEVLSRATGRTGEFFSVREAAPGDSRREINWRASARRGRTLVNEFRIERTGDLLLVIDRRPSTLGRDHDAELLAIECAAAHGIVRGFLSQKARVGLALYGEFLDVVPLGSGRTHRFRLDRALAAAAVSEVSGPAERLAVSLRRYFPPGVTTLVLTPLADEEAVHLLPHLRRRGFPAFVLSPSPLPLLTASFPKDDRGADLVRRLMRLVRRQRISGAWEEAPVLDWEEYWSLGELRRFLSHPAASGRRH